MDSLFAKLKLVDVHAHLCRNIVSIHTSQDLFDDLTDDPAQWVLAQRVEDLVKPPPYQSTTPVIHRPFEDAQWFNVIGWPFKHWQSSRYSDGSFGVWYGSDALATTVYETVHHWYNGLICDAGFNLLVDQSDGTTGATIVTERKVYDVRCDAALIDLRPASKRYPQLTHPTDYTATQALGARLHREGHPGLVTQSVRHAAGHNYNILNPNVLSAPKLQCQLTYRLHNRRVVVEKRVGHTWMEIGL